MSVLGFLGGVFGGGERERERDFGWLSRGDVGTDALLSSFLRGMLLKGKGFWLLGNLMICKSLGKKLVVQGEDISPQYTLPKVSCIVV